MNKVVLIGKLTKDIEVKFLPGDGKAIINFTLAVDRTYKNKDGKREADFINCVFYDKKAETIANWTGKGKALAVTGRIQTRTYVAKDGTNRYVTEIIGEDFQILEWANKNEPAQNTGNNEGYTSVEDSESEIPF